MRCLMRHCYVLLFVCLLVSASAFFYHQARAQAQFNDLRVNESATRAWLKKEKKQIALALENNTNSAVPIRVTLEWLDENGKIINQDTQTAQAAIGQSIINVALPLSADGEPVENADLVWYRLRYRIESIAARASSLTPSEGLLALSELAADLFDLRVVAAEFPLAGKNYQAHLIAVHPLTGRPVRNVKMTAEILWDGEPATPPLKASAATNGEGLAAISVPLPTNAKIENGELRVTGELGEMRGELKIDLREDHLRLANVKIQTDKPLYQPGQAVHTRALIFDFGRRALSDTPVSISIEDPEGTAVFSVETKTSRFGVANADWKIPANARLGPYQLKYEIDDDEHGSQEYVQPLTISRYDLPNFAVSAQVERGYYLPGENAQIKVRSDYLFGQPVKRAQVRIVRESEREWNYREQKWEAEEKPCAEGLADEKGEFTATINLDKQHEELKERTYQRFHDASYAAYVTDPTSGRTEQRRFDVRITREAIHVYVIGGSYARVAGQPLQFYLSASYADGTPAPCDIQINQRLSEEARDVKSLRKFKTNPYGLAKVEGLTVAFIDENDSEAKLQFVARDAKGSKGELEEDLEWYNSNRYVRVETNRPLYRAGEPIEITLTAATESATLILSVTDDGDLVHSQSVRLRKGRAFVVLPYRGTFQGELKISALGYAGENGEDRLRGSRNVMYPHDNELKLDVRMARQNYRPGETATAVLRVTAPGGKATESVLGVSVVDQAVLERARTNNEFGKRNANSNQWADLLGGTENIAGVSKRTLSKLDLSEPVARDLALLAEVLLRDGGSEPHVQGGGNISSALSVFRHFFYEQLSVLDKLLERTQAGEHPLTQTQLRDLLMNSWQVKLEDLRDPWGVSLRPGFSIEPAEDVLTLRSAGSDKRFDTADDFEVRQWRWKYFEPTAERIATALPRLYARTGLVTTNVAELERDFAAEGVNLAALRDRWGKPYRLTADVVGRRLRLSLMSGGPNGAFDAVSGNDDFVAWSDYLDYFAHARQQIDEALGRHWRRAAQFPQNEMEWRAMLAAEDVDVAKLRDPWGRAYDIKFLQRMRISPNVTIHYREYEQAKQRDAVSALSQQTNFLIVRSRGADGLADTSDDFEIAEFSRLGAEAVSQQFDEKTMGGVTATKAATDAISGVITDFYGAVIANAAVMARRRNDNASYRGKTDESGRYSLLNLPTGLYEVRSESPGFKSVTIADVPVRSMTLVELNVTLEAGSITETVMITGEAAQVQTESASVSSMQVASLKLRTQIATPRLREYFPETLLWQPQLETDRAGRAQLQFRLADNITTWKLAAIASTADGQVGLAETDIRAFQPFFIEHDPPRVLTEGDEISLPVTLRNYLPRRLALTSTMQTADWFTLHNPAPQTTEVAAGEAAQAIFNLRATASVENGKQRVTSLGAQASDAIEKPVTVHPDGEEVLKTASDIFAESTKLNVEVPANVIKGSLRAELKVYPNLMAHVFEGIEGILKRPYGCGEQTISSTYPNLLALLYLSKHGDASSSAIQHKAQRYLQEGYERLLSYRTESGGFAYWSRGEADAALTAYALRFLTDAASLIEIDRNVRDKAREFLQRAQQPDGSWLARYARDARHNLNITAFVARALAEAQAKTQITEVQEKTQLAATLNQAFAYLRQGTETYAEPYALAQFALALQASGEHEQAKPLTEKLAALSQGEEGRRFWAVEGGTPFYGWGLAGHIETTALVVRALANAHQNRPTHKSDSTDLPLPMQQGLLYLLRHQDEHGVWLTTQATVAVHEALLQFAQDVETLTVAQGETAQVFVNQQPVGTLVLPAARSANALLTLDLSRYVTAGAHTVEIRRASKRFASAQLVTSYFQPWSAKASESERTLRLAVNYDQTQFKLGGEVTCSIEVGRLSSLSRGMLLAEIGLPPGAEVERASLERVRNEPGTDLDQYDILPDRVVLYLWPRTSGAKLSFKFRPRYGIKAQSAASILYDYYNPSARVTVAPTQFVVQ